VEGESSQKDTKDRILDVAERMFAEHGFAAASLRGITSDAGVNLAAVNYHFGSKEALFESVLSRRIEPLNEARLRQLDRLEADAGPDGPSLERVIECFVGPPLRMSLDPEGGGEVFMRLMGQVLGQARDATPDLLARQFGEVRARYFRALRRAVPDRSDEEVMWRALFMVGAMAHTMALSRHIPSLTDGLCDPTDVEGIIRRLVPFLAAGFRAAVPADPGGAA
jgi:AcrR family transcriptional regulator